MALRTLTIGLTALTLAACNGGGGTDCPVGQVDIDGTCCADANTDGVCDSTCTAPYVDDGAGECVCPTGTTDDGAGGCCTDVDADGTCDPSYANVDGISLATYLGYDPAAVGSEILTYDYDFDGTTYPDPPGFSILMGDSTAGAYVCAFYINVTDETASFPNETSFTDYDDQGNEVPAAAAIGYTVDFNGATVADLTYGGQLPTCAEVMNPDVWTADPVAAIAAGTGSLGIAVVGSYQAAVDAENDAAGPYAETLAQIEGFYDAADWTAGWEGYILEVNYYFFGFSALPFNWGRMAVGTDNGAGGFTVGDWETRTFVADSDVTTTLGAIETDSFFWGFTDEQNVAYALLGVPQ